VPARFLSPNFFPEDCYQEFGGFDENFKKVPMVVFWGS
jgi:hypothetical protein